MESLVLAMLSNALVVTGLALVPLMLGRSGRSPALVHGLWLVVLLKLVTPPIVQVPLAISPVDRRGHRPYLLPQSVNSTRSHARRRISRNQFSTGLASLPEEGTDKGDERAIVETRHHIDPSANVPRAMISPQGISPLAFRFPCAGRHRRPGLLVPGGGADCPPRSAC